MRRLQMGLWGGYDRGYWETYGRSLINGFELAQCPDEEHLAEFARFCADEGYRFGIHCPALAQKEYQLPKITGRLQEEREEAYRIVEREVAIAARHGADYCLIHYPYPPIFPAVQDAAYRNGMPAFEHYESGDLREEELREHSERLFDRVCRLQAEYGQRIVLEYDFFGDHEGLFVELFKQYPEIGLVVDSQRLDVHRRVFPSFDPYHWLDAVALHVYLVHHSTTRYEKGRFHRHLPVLPEQADDPAYGDAYAYLRFLAARNNRFHVTFEHNPRLVAGEQLDACYASVEALLRKIE